MNVETTVGLIALFSGIAIFFVLYAIYAPVVHRQKGDKTSEAVFGQPTYDPDAEGSKYIRPILDNFLPQLPQINLGEENKDKLKALLVKSGNPWKLSVDEFLGISLALGVIGALVGGAIAALGVAPPQVPGFVWPLVLGLIATIGPYAIYTGRKESRSKSVQRQLPEALDLLTITIQSGQTFEYALGNVTRQLPPSLLREEFTRISVALQAGETLSHVLTDTATRYDSTELESFTRAVIQATELGSDPADTLASQAAAVRDNYEARLSQMIAKLDSAVVVPLGATMVPAFLLIFSAPAISQITGIL